MRRTFSGIRDRFGRDLGIPLGQEGVLVEGLKLSLKPFGMVLSGF